MRGHTRADHRIYLGCYGLSVVQRLGAYGPRKLNLVCCEIWGRGETLRDLLAPFCLRLAQEADFVGKVRRISISGANLVPKPRSAQELPIKEHSPNHTLSFQLS